MAEPTKTELAEEISLDEALEAAREAIDKFLNNKFEEAYEIVEPKANNLFKGIDNCIGAIWPVVLTYSRVPNNRGVRITVLVGKNSKI